jgi:hypothetical protein
VKLLRWPGPGENRSKHPYRDTALVYAGFAVFVVVAAALTGGDVKHAVVVAAFVYVVATAWTWFQLRRRKAREDAE